MTRVTAVLACHDRRPLTLAALEALFAQILPADAELAAILVDDGSRDGTAAAVRHRFPRVQVVEADGSLYWSGAMRLGQEIAAAGGADFLLWLNDDVLLNPDALAGLLSWTRHHPGAILVGTTTDPASGRRSYGGQRRTGIHPLRLAPVLPSAQPVACDSFQGNCVLVPQTAFQRLGSIDAAFAGVQGLGDTDYGLRARGLGIPVLTVPGCVGTCPPNRVPPAWRDPGRPLTGRLRTVFGPKGHPPRASWHLLRRHAGCLAPLWWPLPILRALGQTLRPLPPAKPRVALLEGVVPDYRLDCLRPLAAQVAQADQLSLVCLHGQGIAQVTAPPTTACLPMPEERHRNLYWPWSGGRVAWFGGTAGLLCGRFDAVLVGHQVHNLAIWSLWARRRLLGRPRLAITGHMRFSGGLRGRLQRLLLRSADAILPYTESGAAACMAAGLPRDRLFVLNTTLDTTRIRAAAAAVTDAEAAAFRQARDLDTTPLFLFVGRLYREKRCDVAIEAVRLLRRQGRPCQLVIIGEGGERAGLERIAGEDPGIRFVGAERDDRVLALWGRLGLALVLPDAVGLAAVHALALGLPVVAARDGRHHCPELDYVRDGVTGLFADRCEPGDIAATLARLIDSPPLLDHLKAGCAAAAAELSVERMAGVTLAALRHALEAPPEPDRRRALPGLRPGA